MDGSVLLAIGGGAVAVVFAGLLTVVVLRKPPGNERMIEIAAAIQEGAAAWVIGPVFFSRACGTGLQVVAVRAAGVGAGRPE